MKQDEDLRTRIARAAEQLSFDAGRSLERFHASRSRRVVVRRAATIVFALVTAVLGVLQAALGSRHANLGS